MSLAVNPVDSINTIFFFSVLNLGHMKIVYDKYRENLHVCVKLIIASCEFHRG